MIVRALSLREFNEEMQERYITPGKVSEFDNLCLISVQCTPDVAEGMRYRFTKSETGLCVVFFDDVIIDESFKNRGNDAMAYAPTETDAIKIIDFLEANKDKEECLVHCTAGVSRSGAIAQFAHDLYGTESDDQFMIANWRISPNPLLTSLLKAEARKRGLM